VSPATREAFTGRRDEAELASESPGCWLIEDGKTEDEG
jgi:hypothetical protein